MPRVWSEGEAGDYRALRPVQRLGLVCDRLRDQETRNTFERESRYERFTETAGKACGIEASFREGNCKKKEVTLPPRPDGPRGNRASETGREPVPLSSQFQFTQVGTKILAELWVLQRDLHSRFEETQLISCVVCFAIINVRPKAVRAG